MGTQKNPLKELAMTSRVEIVVILFLHFSKYDISGFCMVRIRDLTVIHNHRYMYMIMINSYLTSNLLYELRHVVSNNVAF